MSEQGEYIPWISRGEPMKQPELTFSEWEAKKERDGSWYNYPGGGRILIRGDGKFFHLFYDENVPEDQFWYETEELGWLERHLYRRTYRLPPLPLKFMGLE